MFMKRCGSSPCNFRRKQSYGGLEGEEKVLTMTSHIETTQVEGDRDLKSSGISRYDIYNKNKETMYSSLSKT